MLDLEREFYINTLKCLYSYDLNKEKKCNVESHKALMSFLSYANISKWISFKLFNYHITMMAKGLIM